jgi:hypothetical protein
MPIEERANATHIEVQPHDDALDLLQREDEELQRLFTAIQEARGDSAHGRAIYGDLAKDIIQHLATREAAIVEVGRVVTEVPELGSIAAALGASASHRRELLDQLEKLMSRGVQGMNLNTGQDFDSVLQQVIDTVGPEIERDLADAVPAVRTWLASTEEPDPLKSGAYVAQHAPTSLSPAGPKWYERAQVISRLLTVYDRLRDFPRAVRHR